MSLPLIIVASTALVFLGSSIWAVTQWRRERTRGENLAVENARLEERLQQIVDQKEAVAAAVRAQAAESAQTVADQLVRRATETFDARERLSQTRIEAQLKPVADTLARFELQVAAISRERAAETCGVQTLDHEVRIRDEDSRSKCAPGAKPRWGGCAL